MKSKIVLACLALTCSVAFADDWTQPKITIHEALSVVEKAGYANICEIELEHGVWEVKGRDAEGKKFKVEVDAMTGEMVKKEEKAQDKEEAKDKEGEKDQD